MEYLGIIISFLALLYLYFKQQSFARHQQEHVRPISEEELKEDDALQEFMNAMKKREQQEQAVRHAPPPPKPAKNKWKHAKSPLEEYRLTSSIETRKVKSSLEDRKLKPSVGERVVPHYEVEKEEEQPSRAELAVRRLDRRRDLLIYQEIMDKPKSMRPSP